MSFWCGELTAAAYNPDSSQIRRTTARPRTNRTLPTSLQELANIRPSDWKAILDGEALQSRARERAAARLFHAQSMTRAGRYFKDSVVVGKGLKMALERYRQGAKGGDFRGPYSYAGTLAKLGKKEDSLHWLRKVTDTATAAYLEEAGRMLLQLPHESYRSMSRDMLAAAASTRTS